MWRSLWIILLYLGVGPARCQSVEDGSEEGVAVTRGSQLSKPRSGFRRHKNKDEYDSPHKEKDPEFYSTSYYSTSSETVEKDFNTEMDMENVTTIMPSLTPTKAKVTKQPGVDDFFQEEDLTSEAWASLPDSGKLIADRDAAYKKLKEYKDQMDYEAARGTSTHMADSEWFHVMCFHLGSTIFNAKRNLRDYYRMRYAYYNNKEFEIGYIVHEIVNKYSVVLELFHAVQHRYYNQSRFFDHATSSYMLYMYTVILEQAQAIMHLCNVLHVVDKKYAALAAEAGGQGADGGDDSYGYNVQKNLKSPAQLELERQRKERREMRERLRKQKQRLKDAGKYPMTRRTKSPRSYGNYPRHYGWSVENW